MSLLEDENEDRNCARGSLLDLQSAWH